MKNALAVIAMVTTVFAPRAHAQRGSDTLIVMTVPLKHLTSQQAVELLMPYATTLAFEGQPGGSVFTAPNGRSVTIREKVMTYGRMLKVLSDYDRPPATIGFTFQLIVADKSGSRAPEIASLDSLFRTVLKYTGYKLLGVGVARVGEHSAASETITGEGIKFSLLVEVGEVRTSGNDASARIQVALSKLLPYRTASDPNPQERIFSTRVSVPIGQTVVLGTSALDKDRAIILTVRPQLITSDTKTKEE